MNRLTTLTFAALTIALPACAQQTFQHSGRNTDLQPAFAEQFRAPLQSSGVQFDRQVLATGLDHPWGIALLPDGAGYLVTERAGQMRHITRDGVMSDPIGGVPDVMARRQGGLLDVTLAPDFASTRQVYITYAKPTGGGLSATAAARGTLSADMRQLGNVSDIFVQQPASSSPMHYGSRVLFDGAGHVYVTTGERFGDAALAQDPAATYGKVIRVTRDGAVPADNPFAAAQGVDPGVWSLGHRNIQGATIHDGDLWTIEHGPQGGDELNRIEPGKNYGWPIVTYGENYGGGPVGSGIAAREGFEQPVYFWDPVIAPGGMISYSGALFPQWQGDLIIASLYPGGLVRLSMTQGRVSAEERMVMDLGRIRDVASDSDGALLVVTDFDRGELIRLTPK